MSDANGVPEGIDFTDLNRISEALNHPDVIEASKRVLTVGEFIEKLKELPQHYAISHQFAEGTKALDLYKIEVDDGGWPIVDLYFKELPF